ncbi:MAG: sigma-70 family RNA polymerase sigma factor, partial [Victivallaceae bacterium]
STHSRVIRIPMHMVNTIRDIERVEYSFLRDQGRLPEVNEIAAVLGQPTARISAIVKMARQTVSLQSTVGDDGDSKMTLEHVLKSGGAQPDELVADKVRLESLKQMLGTLSEREQSIIKMRFGLDNTTPKTLVEISRILGVSHERIRQLEKRILEKLRSPECTKYMEGEDMFF